MIYVGGPSPLGEEIAEVLHRKIVPSLLRTTTSLSFTTSAPTSSATEYHFGKKDIASFAAYLVDGDLSDAEIFMRKKLGEGFTASELVLGLMTDAARYLGDSWLDDSASFADVGLGLSSLHSLLKSIDEELRCELPQIPDHKSILLSAMPGDTHVFGLSVLEAFFRNSGWSTHSFYNNAETELLYKISSTEFDVVGLSVSCRDDLSRCKNLVKKIRANSLNQEVRVVVGGAPFIVNRDLAHSLKVDAVCVSAHEALETASAICMFGHSKESDNTKVNV